MILSDTDLLRHIDLLFPTVIADAPHPGNLSIDPDVQVQPASVDLRLGTKFWVYKMGMPADMRIIDPQGHNAKEFMSLHEIKHDGEFVLSPGPEHFCLAATMEYVAMPPDLVARVDGRSSLGRLGLRVHSTAGFVDPGFRGVITLEMDVVGRYPIRLRPGMRIAQLSLHRMTGLAARPYGHPSRHSKYQDSAGATPSLVHKDGEH